MTPATRRTAEFDVVNAYFGCFREALQDPSPLTFAYAGPTIIGRGEMSRQRRLVRIRQSELLVSDRVVIATVFRGYHGDTLLYRVLDFFGQSTAHSWLHPCIPCVAKSTCQMVMDRICHSGRSRHLILECTSLGQHCQFGKYSDPQYNQG